MTTFPADERGFETVGIDAKSLSRYAGLRFEPGEVIIVSFVASGELDGSIFEDHGRVNVAPTRAKRSLVLVGDPQALESHSFYRRMLEWAQKQSTNPTLD